MKYVIATLLLLVCCYLSTSLFNFADAWLGTLCLLLSFGGFGYYIYKQVKIKQVNKNENENENF